MKKLILTGPEATGKTKICELLSDQLGIQWLPEYAREYLLNTKGKYSFDDLDVMSRQAQEILHQQKDSSLIMDTDIITYKIWSDYKFGKTSPWIEQNLKHAPEALYLLCFPDIPWEPDELRENPHDRANLFTLYESLLQRLHLRYFIITGIENVRYNKALYLATDYFK